MPTWIMASDWLASRSTAALRDTILSPGMQSAAYAAIALAFEIYGIPDPPAVRPAVWGYLDEVVEKRHAIAHGRESPVTYGKTMRTGELRQRYGALYDQAIYVLETLNTYALAKRFIAARHRARY